MVVLSTQIRGQASVKFLARIRKRYEIFWFRRALCPGPVTCPIWSLHHTLLLVLAGPLASEPDAVLCHGRRGCGVCRGIKDSAWYACCSGLHHVIILCALLLMQLCICAYAGAGHLTPRNQSELSKTYFALFPAGQHEPPIALDTAAADDE